MLKKQNKTIEEIRRKLEEAQDECRKFDQL